MKAWRLTAPGGELSFRDVPEPAVTDGSVLVRMHAAPLLNYLRSSVEGEQRERRRAGRSTDRADR